MDPIPQETEFAPVSRWRSLTAFLFLLTFALGMTGCHWNRFTPVGNPFHRPPPCVFPAEPTADQVINHLNNNIMNLQGWRCTKAKIAAQGAPVRLDALIAVERPRRFRLMAKSPVGSEVDLGSNPERFWFWARRNESKHVFHAQHEDLAIAQDRLRIPFQPDWLMEAMGVVPWDPSAYRLLPSPQSAGGLQLVSDRIGADGSTSQHMIVVDRCYGWILEHVLYDQDGRLIARAELSGHRECQTSGIVLPHEIRLEWPQAQMSLTISLQSIEVNPLNIPQQIWELPEFPDYPPLDIGSIGNPARTSLAARRRMTSRSEAPTWSDENETAEQSPTIRAHQSLRPEMRVDAEPPPWAN